MKVLHIVTLITPDGAYGGPVRVAVNQATALRESGHEVVIAAGMSGFDKVPLEFGTVPSKLFRVIKIIPGTGYAGISSPSMLWWLVRNVRSFDIIHIHLARDLVTLPAAFLAAIFRKDFVVQTHGMIDQSSNIAAQPLDLLFTRPVLRAAKRVFFLTENERCDLVSVVDSGLRLDELRNGVPVSGRDRVIRLDTVPEVLFLARLQKRKRPMLFVEMADRLVKEGVPARFAIVGPDEGEGEYVLRAITTRKLEGHLVWDGPVSPENTEDRFRQAEIYVLPSVEEPYPMSVLEAMAAGLPVVVSDSCGLAQVVEEFSCGIVTQSDDADSLSDAVRFLVSHRTEARDMGERGAAAAVGALSMKSVVSKLISVYMQESRSVR